MVEIILIGSTLAAAIIGTLWKDPPHHVKHLVIAFAVLTSVATLYKSYSDDKDKQLLQTLAIAGLALPNSAYEIIYDQLHRAYPDAPISNCRHSNEGMTCSVKAVQGKPPRAHVFNRYEVARVYADAIRGKDTESYLREIIRKQYNPKQPGDEFGDKLGILGFATFYDMCGSFPVDYNYHDDKGVSVNYLDGSRRKQITLTRKDLSNVEPDLGLLLFGRFEEKFREDIRNALPDCK